MARKPRIEKIFSRHFTVIIREDVYGHKDWFVRDNETLADTDMSRDYEAYYSLKRVWRKSKENFDSACRFMEFNNLFSKAGVKL